MAQNTRKDRLSKTQRRATEGYYVNNTLYCSFCGKSQEEVRRLIAGPTVFICDGCADLFAELVINGKEPADIWDLLPSLTKALKSHNMLELEAGDLPRNTVRLLRSIEFLPEHRQAGIGILNYFSKYLSERFPDLAVKVVIEQEANKVRMIVESEDGAKEIVEQTLEEYALIVTGKATPSDFLSNQYQVLELNQKLEMAAMEIRWQNRFIVALETEKKDQRDFFIKQIEHLNQSVALGITNSTKLIAALDKLARRPAIDSSVQAAIERIMRVLREDRALDEEGTREDLVAIAGQSPSILRELFNTCIDSGMGAAGSLLASWISPLLSVLPR